MEKPTISVTTEPAGTRKIRLTVTVPEEQVRQKMCHLAREISENVAIPGFRKGKAPYAIILQYYGERRLREQVAEDLTREVYKAALEQEGLEPFGPAMLEEVQISPMQFTFTVPLSPVVRLGDYRSLRVEFPPLEVTEDEIQSVLEDICRDNSVLEPVEGRGAQPGDVLRISVEGRTDQGQVFLKDDEVDVPLAPEDPYPAPGFFTALEGMMSGEERTFRLKMPGGQPSEEAEFSVHLHGLYRQILPELDDDLARTFGPFHTLAELKEEIRQRILERKEETAKEEYTQEVIERLVSQVEVEYPSVMLEEELGRLTERLGQRIRASERMTLEDYLKVTGQTMDDLRKRLHPVADTNVRQNLVLLELVRAEGLSVSDDEVEQYLQKTGESQRSESQSPEYRKRLSSQILYEKIVDRLLAIARGEFAEPATGGSRETS